LNGFAALRPAVTRDETVAADWPRLMIRVKETSPNIPASIQASVDALWKAMGHSDPICRLYARR
jgi:hypothetical protein